MATIRSISPVDGRYATMTEELVECFSEMALIRNRVKVELAWLALLCKTPSIPEARPLSELEQEYLSELVDGFSAADAGKIKRIERRTRHDVKAVEYFLRGAFEKTTLSDLCPFIHFGCTSEDINNLAQAMMLQDGLRVLGAAQDKAIAELTRLAREWKSVPMIARTHGQTATPTTVGKELAVFAMRLGRLKDAIDGVEFFGKFNGAVGAYNAHCIAYPDVDWIELSRQLIEDGLGLRQNAITTQIEPHDFQAQLCQALALWNTALIDLDRDMWQYISLGYFTQIAVPGEVGSSTMPHKVNPIDFENSEGNAGLANALLYHFAEKLPISRLQRDLSDSTVIRSFGTAFAHALIAYKSTLKGLSKIALNTKRIDADLDEAWEALAEPIQTVLRKAGVENAYERLKDMTRGKTLTRGDMIAFVGGLNLPEADKARLLNLTPRSYTGLAAQLVERLPV